MQPRLTLKRTLKLFAPLAFILLCCMGLASNIGEASAGAPAALPATSQGVQKPIYHGRGGKISLPPEGDWQQGGKLADSRPPSALLPSVPADLPVFGTDTALASGTSNEVTIAANPINPLNFVAGANLFAGTGTGRYTTTDGGNTWVRGSFTGCCDPTVTFDEIGSAYFGYLPTASDCPSSGALVRRSTDGGINWGSAVRALSGDSTHFIDKDWISADIGATSPYKGRIYAAATSFRTPPGCADIYAYIDNSIVIAYSTDRGATWSAQSSISDASHNQNQFADPVAAPNGTVYSSYQYQNCTTNCAGVPMYNLITKSTDGGVTWSPSITVTGQPISYTGVLTNGYQYLYAYSNTTAFRHNDQPVIGVSPTDSNQLYMLWTDGRFESTFTYEGATGLHADILFSRSTDGGATWSTPRKINDDNVQGKDQFFPWMTVGSNGTIHAAWLDRRDDVVNGFAYRTYYSQSTDGGLTWSVNQPVADVGSTPGNFIGDYNGIAVSSDNNLVVPVWTDQRSSQVVYADRGVLNPGGGTPTSTASATSTPICNVASWNIVDSANPGTASNLFQGISASASNDVYAVGYYNSGAAPSQSLIERWDGTSWSAVAHPITGTSTNSLFGVADIAANNVWAVGSYRGGSVDQTLTLHYDGASWTIVPSPNTGAVNNHLVAVSGTSTNDVWAVGDYSGASQTQPLIMHYDGSNWTIMPAPAIPDSTYINLKGVTAIAPNDVWAAGSYGISSSGGAGTLILHWDGSTWSISPSANAPGRFNSLLAIDAVASNDVWAAGNVNPNPGGTGNVVSTLIEHWNGTQWSVVSSPSPGTSNNFLNGVSATSTNDVWVVGSYNSGGSSRTLIEHWDGTQWSVSPSQNVNTTFHSLYGVVGIAPNDAWAVGYYGATGAYRTLAEHYATAQCTTGTPTGTSTRTTTQTATGTAIRTSTVTSTQISTGTSTRTPSSTAQVVPSSTATAAASTTSTPPAATSTIQPSATSTSGLATSTTVPPTACPIQFQDVASDNTFYPFVRCLACRGILGGYPCGGTGEPCGTTNNPYFRPGVSISRGQIAKIVSQSAGFNEAPGNQIYEDVPMASPFYDYINRLSNRGYIGGYPCGQLPSETCITPNNRPYFRPSSNATRGQLSKIVATAAMITDPVSGQIYTDVGTDSPFYKWIQQLSARNVMSGYPCGGAGEPCDSQNRPYFRPNADVTRGQASKIVANTFSPSCNTPVRP